MFGIRNAGFFLALFRNSRPHRWLAERNKLCDQCKHPDVPRNRVMIVKLKNDAHDEEQTLRA